MLRDVLCNEVPLLFRKELYASVSVVTGALYLGAQALGLNANAAVLIALPVGLALAAGAALQLADAQVRVPRRLGLIPFRNVSMLCNNFPICVSINFEYLLASHTRITQ